ncbi:CPBP family intramembrane glutamic endopeptidase [Tellurirhabdus rosea]|uniref:CPBP family intramembrane glutamic endopeptidase n=1 Tax=Tellurirhabdus rosea TaxID=2674997 RepID=UPI00225AFE77|nr:CPBP family intramembrane glutamic endopeptidase [Tellurirhabdus rosea]
MKQLIRFVRDHWRADFRPDLYGLVLLFLALAISVNYYVDLEDSVIDAYRSEPLKRMGLYFLLYACAYYPTAFFWTHFNRRKDILRQRDFWLFSLFGLGIFSIYAGFYEYERWSSQLFGGEIYTYAFYLLSNLHSLLTVLLPLILFYRFVPQPDSDFYGLKPKWSGLRLYGWLLLLMLPLVAIASFQPSFLQSYPSYRDTNANEFLAVPEWVTALGFELAYGWDFIPTELLFRGFLVIGMTHILGRGAVLPMVVTYAFIHFGKPPGETISSVIGGYILGVFALKTRSVWGGIIVHLGVAWLMEAAAFLQMLND